MSVIKLLQLVIGGISVHRSQPSWVLINKVFAVCGLIVYMFSDGQLCFSYLGLPAMQSRLEPVSDQPNDTLLLLLIAQT